MSKNLGVISRLAILSLLTAAICSPVWSNDNDSFEDSVAIHASKLLGPLLVAGELSLLSEGETAAPKMLQGAKAVTTAVSVAGLLQRVVPAKRPGDGNSNGFPSGHTAMAFAMAEVVSTHKPKSRSIAYGIAAVIGWSRVDVEAHHWGDVIGGAALGYLTAKHFTKQQIVFCPVGAGYTSRF